MNTSRYCGSYFGPEKSGASAGPMPLCRAETAPKRQSLLSRWGAVKRIALIALGLLIVAGAAHADDRTALLGTWHGEKTIPQAGVLTSDMTFAKDGTFYGHVDRAGQRIWNFAGKWDLKEKWLHYNYTKSDVPDVPPGATDKDRVIEITQTMLKLQTDSGEETWVRKK